MHILSNITDKISNITYRNYHVQTKVDISDDSTIVNLLSKFIMPILMIFGFYVHSHGDYTPGGGFQAGVIFACVLVLYYFINFSSKLKVISETFLTLLAMIGFVFYTGTGIIGFFITGNFLDYTFLPFISNNAIGVFIVELGIAFVVFSGIGRIFSTMMEMLKDLK